MVCTSATEPRVVGSSLGGQYLYTLAFIPEWPSYAGVMPLAGVLVRPRTINGGRPLLYSQQRYGNYDAPHITNTVLTRQLIVS